MRLHTLQDSPILDWGWAGAALQGEPESGDLHLVIPRAHGGLIAVIDGLGHGPEAAHAAREAAAILSANSSVPLADLFACCHEGLRHTRGVVMSLAAIDTQSSNLAWFGVGNVEAVLLREDVAHSRIQHAISVRGGVLGYRLPPVRIGNVSLLPGDLLVMATDGVRSDFSSAIALDWEPQAIADWLMFNYATGADDALVLVGRYLGETPWHH